MIGGQRCGTTSLHASLADHAEIRAGFRKEVHYFDLHHERGEAWYRANFPLRRGLGGRSTFEATPNYLASVDTPRLMSALLPDVKLIALLRNPIERTHSSWRLRKQEGAEDRDFTTAIEDELAGAAHGYDDLDEERNRWQDRAMRWSYMEKSCYDEHFERWFEFFDPRQFLILQSEALFSDPAHALAQIQDFLEIRIDPSITLPQINAARSTTIDPVFREYLSAYFAPHIKRLSETVSQDFDWS